MKILLTGASSFTGLWFAEALAEKGHHVTAVLRREDSHYQGIRRLRVERLKKFAALHFNAPFGTQSFFNVLETHAPFDIICHHAAEVTNYKSAEFDFAAALASNTLNIGRLFDCLKQQKCRKIILTGSVFEQREGLSSDGAHAVSPYGLSKGLTSDVFSYYAALYEFRLGKFVIPNPFGPYEEARFTTYLAKCWLEGRPATVSYPDYVRDNIPACLLAKSYAAFVESLPDLPGYCQLNPSYKPAPQACFVQEFAQEMQSRLGVACDYTLQKQIHFSEPKVRINSHPLDLQALAWNESLSWDMLANYYLQTFHQAML